MKVTWSKRFTFHSYTLLCLYFCFYCYAASFMFKSEFRTRLEMLDLVTNFHLCIKYVTCKSEVVKYFSLNLRDFSKIIYFITKQFPLGILFWTASNFVLKIAIAVILLTLGTLFSTFVFTIFVSKTVVDAKPLTSVIFFYQLLHFFQTLFIFVVLIKSSRVRNFLFQIM